MADFGFIPNLVASGDISPFRFVKISGAFQGAQAAAEGDYAIGVTDGSVNKFDGTFHAVSGQQISLQPTNTVQIECGGNVTAGAFLESDANGKAVAAGGAAAVSSYIALEGGASGEIIRAFRFGYRGPVFS
jgi:hypothetical protein